MRIDRVLCVEDNSEKYMAIFRFLCGQNVSEIEWVTNAERALDALETAQTTDKPYDLLLSDMHFDFFGQNDSEAGEKLIHLIRERGYDLPVIICSSQNWIIPGAFGCIFYNPERDWELDAANLIRKLRSQ